jgi:hypothetical protein
MGHEIVYCYWCSGRILGADIDKGAAVLIGNHACCAQCLPKVMASLPDKQRETLLTELSRASEGAARPPTRNTPRSGTERSSNRTPRGGSPTPASPRAPRSTLPLMTVIGGLLIALALLLLFVSGGKKERPEDRREIGLPPSPPPQPAIPDREKSARDGILRARDAARSGIDIDLQVRLWEEAVANAERTPALEEAARERAAILVRRNEVYAQELAKLRDSVDGVVRQEEFKKALEALASARRRHDFPEWTQPIDRKIEDVKKAEAGGGPYRQSSDADDLVCFEAERFHLKVDRGDHAWTLVTAPAGFTGTGAMVALPNNNTIFPASFTTASPRMDYRVQFLKTGRHYLWIRGYAENGNDDSVHAGLDGMEIKSSTAVTLNANKKWNWTTKTMAGAPASFDVATAGLHTVNLWMREDGAIIDRVVLTTNAKYVPKDAGPPESPR